MRGGGGSEGRRGGKENGEKRVEGVREVRKMREGDKERRKVTHFILNVLAPMALESSWWPRQIPNRGLVSSDCR